MRTSQKESLNISCQITFEKNTKRGYLFLKSENKIIKAKKDIKDILLHLLNNSDSIIKRMESYIDYLSSFTLKTYEFSSLYTQQYNQIPVSYSKLSLFYILNLNFEEIFGKDHNLEKKITEYIFQSTHPYAYFGDYNTQKKLDCFPNPNNEILINSLKQTVDLIKQFKDSIPNIFILSLKKKKYLYDKSNYILPRGNIMHNKDDSKSYVYAINNLQDFFNASIYCITESKLVIGTCIVCNSFYISSASITTCSQTCRNKSYASGTKSIKFKNSPEVATFLNKIRSYLNKTTLKDSEKNKLRKELKIQFESDYSDKVKDLKSKYGQKYNSAECQSSLYNWLDENYKKFQEYFPSKKIGNTNAKK